MNGINTTRVLGNQSSLDQVRCDIGDVELSREVFDISNQLVFGDANEGVLDSVIVSVKGEGGRQRGTDSPVVFSAMAASFSLRRSASRKIDCFRFSLWGTSTGSETAAALGLEGMSGLVRSRKRDILTQCQCLAHQGRPCLRCEIVGLWDCGLKRLWLCAVDAGDMRGGQERGRSKEECLDWGLRLWLLVFSSAGNWG